MAERLTAEERVRRVSALLDGRDPDERVEFSQSAFKECVVTSRPRRLKEWADDLGMTPQELRDEINLMDDVVVSGPGWVKTIEDLIG